MEITNSLTLSLAFIAGLVSFISPCVLPLVPAYVGYMGGRMTNSVARATSTGHVQTSATAWSQRFITFTHSLFFVAGFSFVFVTIGLLSTAFVQQIGGSNISAITDLIGRIGGIVIIFFGLHFMGILPRWLSQLRDNQELISNPLMSIGFAIIGTALILWGFGGNVFIWDSQLWEFTVWAPLLGLIATVAFLVWLFLGGAFTSPAYFWRNTIDRVTNALYMDTRRDMQAGGNEDKGFGSSAIMGVVFSAGWTPCIGPVYGAVLTMAAGGGDVAQAGGLLATYSLGLGVPFMLTALALDSAQSVLRRLQRHMHKIELASGAFLILIGVLVATGQLQALSQRFAGEFADFSISVEESVLEAIVGTDETAATIGENPITNDLGSVGPAQSNPTVSPTLDAPIATDVNTSVGSITELAAGSRPSSGISIGNLAPDFETVTDDGQPIKLSDHRGEIVLLNFWATWCGPCRIEMPEFEAIFNEHSDQGFNIIAINNAESVADVQGFREEFGLSFTLAMDERADIQNQYNIFSYPSTFLLDRDGTILARHFGALTAEQVQQIVDDALAS